MDKRKREGARAQPGSTTSFAHVGRAFFIPKRLYERDTRARRTRRETSDCDSHVPQAALDVTVGSALGVTHSQLLPDGSVGELYLYRVRTGQLVGRPAPRAEVDPQVSAVGFPLHGPLLAILVRPGNRHELARL